MPGRFISVKSGLKEINTRPCFKSVTIHLKHFAYACHKMIDLSVIGESVLVSHVKGTNKMIS